MTSNPTTNMGRYWTGALISIPPQVWLALVTFACLAPFLHKAFHIDDTLFLRAAQQIQQHPADFYGFQMNWFGTTQPMIDNFDNPPLTCYYIALAAAVAGWSEPALHLAFILPAVMVILGVFSLAKRYCSRPAVAAAVALCTPVFLISATTLMSDVLLLALWVWALYFFELGLQEDRSAAFLLSGCLAGMAVLCKFVGLALLPLLAAYGWHRQRRIGRWLFALATPLLLAAAFELTTYSLYGKGLFFTAAGVSSKAKSHGGNLLERNIVGLSFVGGCFVPLLLFVPNLWSLRRTLVGLGLVLPCLLAFPRLGKYSLLWTIDGKPDWTLFLQSALFLSSGLHVLLLAAFDAWHHRSSSSILLSLWILGIFVFAADLNWTLNGRSILPMLPAVGILIARRLDEQLTPANLSRRRWFLWPVVPATALSLLLIKSDYNLAAAGRVAAAESCAKYLSPARTLWFEGHWGFQYYVEGQGAKALERGFAYPNKGDVVVVPSEAVNTFDISIDLVRLIETLEYRPNMRCSTMSLSAGAGFYSATAGPFPFSVGRVDPERYYVFEVVQSLEQASKAPDGISKTGALTELFELERRSLECEAAIRRNPNHERAHFQLGLCLTARGKPQEAAEQFSEVLRINPDNGNAHLELAVLSVRLSQRTQALSHYRAAVRLMPESSRARDALATFLDANRDLQTTGTEASGPVRQ